jgi:hypothetical protein
MGDSISNSNRTPNGSGTQLPNVGAGDKIRPAMFNRLAEGIDRATLQFGPGLRVTKTASSTIVSKPQSFEKAHPFKAFFVGGNGSAFLTFKLGNVFSIALSNTWVDNNSVVWSGTAQYDITDKKKGFHAKGSEIMFDVAETNYISSSHIQDGEVLQLPYKEGLYYIELTQWSGLQLEAASGASAARAALVAGWNEYSKNMKGRLRPVIKYANRDTMVAINYNRMVIPLCTVDSYERIFQACSSDIFLTGDLPNPGTTTVTEQGATGKLMVYPLTVNRIIPKMNSEYLDATEAPHLEFTEEGYVLVKCLYEANTFFPRKAEIIFASGDNLDNWGDTTTESYFPLAKINVTGSGSNKVYTVTQLSKKNLVVNRLKAGSNQASWWWDES